MFQEDADEIVWVSGDLKTLEQFDFKFTSGIPRPQIQEPAGLSFIGRQENIGLWEPSDVGKTHPAVALESY
ncbi:hypothetical protein ATP50_09675 [Salmonella enterica]|nr:hypothetical protein [Salmonella enterica]